MSNPKYHASARVTLVLDVEHGSSYGGECSLEQIHKQASQETQQAVEELFRTHKARLSPVSVRVDKVFVRITEEKS